MSETNETTGRKSGAQPGNKNAEKHGFYSKRFNQDESERLERADTMSLESDIKLLRIYVDRISNLVALDGDKISEDDLKALNTLSLLSQSISGMIRTHFLTKGRGGAIEQGIMDALNEIRIEMGI